MALVLDGPGSDQTFACWQLGLDSPPRDPARTEALALEAGIRAEVPKLLFFLFFCSVRIL